MDWNPVLPLHLPDGMLSCDLLNCLSVHLIWPRVEPSQGQERSQISKGPFSEYDLIQGWILRTPLGRWSQDLCPFSVASCYPTKLGFSAPCTETSQLITASASGGRNQLLFCEMNLQGDGGRCLQICLPSSGFGAKFKTLGRTVWSTEMLVGQIFIGGLQAFVVRF